MDEGGSDVEYGGTSVGSHMNIGQHSFSQMQVCATTKYQFEIHRKASRYLHRVHKPIHSHRELSSRTLFSPFRYLLQGDLDRQRLLGYRQRTGVYESVIDDGVEGIEHQER